MEISVKVEGKPEPEITWFHQDKQNQTGGSIEVSQTDAEHTLLMKDCKPSQTGLVRVEARNVHGKQHLEFPITVRCKSLIHT